MQIRADLRDVLRRSRVILLLALVVSVIGLYELESRSVHHISLIALAGFPIHALLPARFRLPFFLAISCAGILAVLGYPRGVWLIGIAVFLFAVLQLPGPAWLRAAIFLSAAAFLAAVQLNWLEVFLGPRSAPVLTILGSMFMFRTMVYLYDRTHDKVRRPVALQLAYFLPLPNVCFPLFPVLDYRTFCRGYYGTDPWDIYERGAQWMFRGVTHLLLYRIVYFHLAISPESVHDLGDLVRFLVTNFLLYLRISGQFHLIVGMLHLFGFALPETNHRYLLASSFTDFWRRINIYWKDFMMKVFYYPAYMKLKRWGATPGLILATLFVFLVTWVLHSYQWFWLRGSFPLTVQDGAFWSVLGLLVVLNVLWEERRGRRRMLGGRALTVRERGGHALRVAGTFGAIVVLWSLWTCDSLDQWLSLWSAATVLPSTPGNSLWALSWTAILISALAVHPAASGPIGSETRARPADRGRLTVLAAFVSGAVLVLGLPVVHSHLGEKASYVARTLQSTRLSDRDARQLLKGYYENLLNVDRFNAPLWELYMDVPSHWRNIYETRVIRETGDFLWHELIPGSEDRFKGTTVRVNRWGMRDKEYEIEKPAGVVRMAVLGGSDSMGSGVEGHEVFESILEDKLNASVEAGAGYEILNFAMEGYRPPQFVPLLENRVLPFRPDVLLYVGHTNDLDRSVFHMARVASSGIEVPYDDLRAILPHGSRARLSREEAERQLNPLGMEILDWTYRRIVETCRREGIRPLWTIIPTFWEEPPEITRAVIASARRAGFEVMDLMNVFDGEDPEDLMVAVYDVHWNARAHRRIAERLYAELEQLGIGGRRAVASRPEGS